MIQLLNLDGLVGPSHHYAGLALGNLASAQHKGQISSPREAALQGLKKMKHLSDLGLTQGLIPPQARPDLSLLFAAGFRGSHADLLEQAYKHAPELLEACYSASAMWAANSATITPSCDSHDQRLQITPANLISTLHRSLEVEGNLRFFQQVFNDPHRFNCHAPLPPQAAFADEGAANHIRLSDPASGAALHLFVYGRNGSSAPTHKYPARQSRLACEAIIRNHQLDADKAMLIQQNPVAIDAGAFHNDVVAVGNQNLLLVHQQAFADQPAVLQEIRQRTRHWETPLEIVEIAASELSLADTIKSYLFNSQLLSLPGGEQLLLAPAESQECSAAARVCDHLLQSIENLSAIEFINLRQSMHNGGGPACLRLAVPISTAELRALHPGILLTASRYQQLQSWVERHYRDRLSPDDLRDPQLIDEISAALDELGPLLGLPQLYN